MAAARRVLVLGGGFSAVHASRAMARGVAAGELDVTVVTRDNFLCAHGLIPEMVTGWLVPGTILSPARRIFGRAHVHVGEIERIDLDARRVHTTRHLDGARFELEYDDALLAVGTSETLDAYPGLAEHAYPSVQARSTQSFERACRRRRGGVPSLPTGGCPAMSLQKSTKARSISRPMRSVARGKTL